MSPNRANVEALANLIKKAGLPTPRGAPDTGWFDPRDYVELAESLAALGCLVPIALTERQVDSLLERDHLPDRRPYDPVYDGYDYGPQRFIEMLEQVARGNEGA